MLPGRLERGDARAAANACRTRRGSASRLVAGSSRSGNPRSTGTISIAPMTTNGSQAEKHPAPARVLGQRPRDDRPEERRQHPGRRHRREDLRSQVFGIGRAEDDVDRGDEQAGAEALDAAPGDELGHRRRGARKSARPAMNETRPASHRPARAAGVADLSGDDHAHDVGDEETGERPADRPEAVHLARRRRQRGGDGHRLEGDQRDQDQDSAAGAAVLRREDRAGGRAGGRRRRSSAQHAS